MAVKGWNAAGVLQPLWNRYEGGRDALAAAVGTSPSVLSSINTGSRNLGHNLAGRLADELGVTVLELGAPNEEDQSPRVIVAQVIEQLERLLAQLPPPKRAGASSKR